MKVELEKQTREKIFTKFDTNRLGAGAFILTPDGNLEKDLSDETMKARNQNQVSSIQNPGKKEKIPTGFDGVQL